MIPEHQMAVIASGCAGGFEELGQLVFNRRSFTENTTQVMMMMMTMTMTTTTTTMMMMMIMMMNTTQVPPPATQGEQGGKGVGG